MPRRDEPTIDPELISDYLGVRVSRRDLLRITGMSGGSLALAALLAACSSNGSGTSPTPSGGASGSTTGLTGTVQLFGFEDDMSPAVMKPFQTANPSLEVQRAIFNSSDEAVTKLEAGFKADVIDVCVRDTGRLVQLNQIQPIDTSKITAYGELFPAMVDLVGVKVNDQTYMLPDQGGIAGIVYNPNVIPELTSYKQMFEDPRLRGKVTMEGDPYYAMAVGALALGYKDPYNLTSDDLSRVKDYFHDHIDQIRTFYSGDSQFLALFQNGEIAAGQGFPDYQRNLAKSGVPVAFNKATEGTLTWVCGFSIGTHSQNTDAAYGVLNFFMSPVAQAWFAENYYYLVSNQQTLADLTPKLVKQLGLNDPGALFNGTIATQIAPNYDEWLSTWQQIQSA
jgi:spermidine/putrescine transport system substrate-binding protein